MINSSTKYTDAIFDVLKDTYPYYLKFKSLAEAERIYEILLTTYQNDSSFNCYQIADLLFFNSEDHYLAAIFLL